MTDRRQLALITGASHPRDIGTAICRKLAAQGLNICFTYWKADPEWIHTFQAELSATGISSEAFEIDLSAPDAAERVLAHTIATGGTPSVLINNAAHSTHTDLATLDVTALDAITPSMSGVHFYYRPCLPELSQKPVCRTAGSSI